MAEIGVIKLSEKKNRWVIGTPEEVGVNDVGYSPSVQIKYSYQPTKKEFENETYHTHIENIVECYLVLHGSINVRVEDQIFELREKEALRVPSNHCHKVMDFSEDVEYLTIRAPPSYGSKKRLCY